MTKKDIIKLRNGREVHVRAIEIVETYRELFVVGEPDTYDNIHISNRIECPKN